MKIELFIDAHTISKTCQNFRWGFYILRDDETRQHTLFDSEVFADYQDALSEARAAAKWLFPNVHIAGVYPAPGMIEGNLPTT